MLTDVPAAPVSEVRVITGWGNTLNPENDARAPVLESVTLIL